MLSTLSDRWVQNRRTKLLVVKIVTAREKWGSLETGMEPREDSGTALRLFRPTIVSGFSAPYILTCNPCNPPFRRIFSAALNWVIQVLAAGHSSDSR
jgi:hypothetical protein